MSRLSDEKNEDIKKLKAFSEQKSEELRVCFGTTDFHSFSLRPRACNPFLP